MSKLSYNFGAAALSRLLIGGIGLTIVGFLTRALGPAGYGYYSLIFAYLFIFSTLADLGLYTILVREISRPSACLRGQAEIEPRVEPDRAAVMSFSEARIVGNIFSLRALALIVLLLTGGAICWFLPYPLEVRVGILIAGIAAALSSLTQILTGIFQKHLRLYWVSLADVFGRTVQLILVWFLVNKQFGLTAFIGAVVAAEAVHFLMVLIFSRRLVEFKFSFDFNYWKKTINTALPVAVSMVFVLLYFKMDTVLLSLMKPAFDVGVYAVAYKILEIIIFFPAAYIGLIMPVLSRHAAGDQTEFSKIYKKTFDILAIFGLPAMFYLILRAPDVIAVIGGGDFNESIGVLRVLSIAIMLIFFGNLGGSALVALDLQKKGLGIYLAGAIFNIGANLLLIPRFSYYAAAWTTVLTELLVTVALFWLIKKKTGFTVNSKVFLRSLMASLLTILLLYPFRFNFIYASVLALGYFPILFWLGGFDQDDIREIISLKGTSSFNQPLEL